ncbi:hypothetical protein P5673_012989 [Acropora cervicornis]|uniref:Uncharacterized protein n=1 Tax=Acropora cervicornis TaxID=6130 RepID=A0AAD9QMD9_ACRCE|nr:hypothetical protein P5673_012989 [Acropora cervicornis]
MVLQQCLACNLLITGPTRSCSCGHVLEDPSRFIGGKRFSDYRAMLYGRLEDRRKREEKRMTNNNPVSPKQPPFKTPARAAKFKETRKNTKRRKETTSRQLRKTKKASVPQELHSRFPSALQRINQKILGQNLLWLVLQMESGENRIGLLHDES